MNLTQSLRLVRGFERAHVAVFEGNDVNLLPKALTGVPKGIAKLLECQRLGDVLPCIVVSEGTRHRAAERTIGKKAKTAPGCDPRT